MGKKLVFSRIVINKKKSENYLTIVSLTKISFKIAGTQFKNRLHFALAKSTSKHLPENVCINLIFVHILRTWVHDKYVVLQYNLMMNRSEKIPYCHRNCLLLISGLVLNVPLSIYCLWTYYVGEIYQNTLGCFYWFKKWTHLNVLQKLLKFHGSQTSWTKGYPAKWFPLR